MMMIKPTLQDSPQNPHVHFMKQVVNKKIQLV
ncbi:hypothetical protein FOPG_19474 [Fusarium oxysporum f. sp. conglutinans race 2 54008]|uniref:Uncharacterized protein n=1 Tax=Fusarium oxysporum f. sp. conglutinans race 2 54008 TaxID=1089457 RepID=X0GLT0_FUSOX|nr:hypothetical protein FOPG_19474 [Fusarium oxysporum f. sp. conglutinans race 2 54008]